MEGIRSAYRSGSELVGAFLEQPLPKELYRLSRFAKVTPPWGPPPHGSGPEEYAAAWAAGYDGGPIRAAFRWIGQHGLESLIPALPKSLQSRGRAPKAPPIHEFVEIPEVERLTRYLLRHGAAMHDIQELLFAFREVWSDLDRLRPDVWGIEELAEVLAIRNQRVRSMDAIPASFAFVWGSSSDAWHRRQIAKAQRLLAAALREVMPGHHA